MKTSALLLSLAGFFFGGEALAACEKEVAKAEAASGVAVADAFKAVITCDAKIAEQVFFKVMQKTGDSESLVALSMVAIEGNVWKPVWEMPGKISDYEARDVVAEAIGEQCATNEKVVSFLQGAYFGLRDVEFGRFEKALVACQAPTFDAWLQTQIENPPAKQYDEKWAKLAEIYVDRKKVEALPSLSKAGVKAAQTDGPYTAILNKMNEAVTPRMGEKEDPSAQKALEDALVAMAKELPADKARPIADQLSNAGNDAAAASLLPAIYPDRFVDGQFTYAAVSVEAGTCKGVKTATLHVASLTEPGKRYVVGAAAEAPMRAFKPANKKCTPDEGAWSVVISEEPVKGPDGVNALYDVVAKQWADKGYTVKRKDEKPGALN
jgi:hypothetical protein